MIKRPVAQQRPPRTPEPGNPRGAGRPDAAVLGVAIPSARSADMDGAEAATSRILIIDNHALFREGIAQICDREPDLHVVGQAQDGRAAVALVRRESPDVVLLDVGVPGLTTEEIVGQIVRDPCAPRVAILTMNEDARIVRKLLSIGAQAYISKESTREELLAAIRAVGRDQDHVVLSVPKRTMEQLTRPAEGPLSVRELEVIDLVARGLTNTQIGSKLYISQGTVKRHLTNIYVKLDVRSRMNAVNKVVSMGLLGAGA